jgi:hypothetical protein
LQERIAWGDDLPAPFILALHLYTVPCNLFQLCCKHMRDGDHKELETFHVFLLYLWKALTTLNAKPMTVYRGLFNVDPAAIIKDYKDQIRWPAFSSTTFDQKVHECNIFTLLKKREVVEVLFIG